MCGCRGSKSTATTTAAAAPPPRRAPAEDVVLRYVGKVSLLVKGGVSGRAYALRPGARISCDRRDVTSFLGSPLFERPEPTGSSQVKGQR
jgi:hypothetical protein